MREALLRVSSSEISFKEAIKYDFS